MFIELIILALLLFFAFSNLRMLQRRFALPPGPFPWPLIGNLYQLDPVKPYLTMKKWSKIYGPVFTVWIGIEPTVIITDYNLMEEAMIKHGDHLASRPDIFVFDNLVDGKFGILMTNGEKWKEQRRFVLHVLRNFGLGRNLMQEKILVEAKRLAASIQEDMGSANEIAIDLSTSIHWCMSNILTAVLFGYTFEKGDTQYELLREWTNQANIIIISFKILLVNSFPMLQYVPLFGHFGLDELRRLNRNLETFFKSEVEKHKRALDENGDVDEEPKDFLDSYLKEIKRRQREGEDASYFSEWHLWIIANELWSTGGDTTTSTLLWAILAMINYPDVQQKVHQEIEAVLGRERTPTMADRRSMPYVMATLNEVDRWANITPINFTHSNDQDFQLAGYKIPKGTSVVPQIANLAIDEKAFPNPEQFRPERFLEDDGKTIRKMPYAPFGMGKRQCTGEGMARAQLFLFFVYFLQQFKVAALSGETKLTEEPSSESVIAAPTNYKCLVSLR